MELETIIGLEIHVQLKTKSKMFCSCANIFGDVPPNSAICPICLGYPGTLPVPNRTAIEWVQRAGAALHCELAQASKFDRKSYFYPDLPKGYQISQYDQPFCGPGHLDIVVEGVARRLGITRIHLEEDAAKNLHPKGADYTLVDFNRAGTPLAEIVTEPDFRTPLEARLFLQELQRIMRSLGISDADMEKGQLRCDANISLRPKEAISTLLQGEAEGGKSGKLYPKTEVKNINSFKFVEKALLYEIKRQTELWEKGEAPKVSSTRGFDSATGVTTEHRTKEEAADYRYFPEPDIPPFVFTAKELEQVKGSVPELPGARQARYVKEYGLPEQQARQLADNLQLGEYLEDTVSELNELDQERLEITAKDIPALTKLSANMILRHLREISPPLQGGAGGGKRIAPENFAELVVMVHQNTINKNAIDQVLREMQRTGGDPDAIIQNLGLEQVSNTGELDAWIDDAIKANPDVVEKIKAGKEAAMQFLMGQVMAKSKGKASPVEVIKLLRQKILG